MSITVSTDVFCDGCTAWIDGVTGPRSDSLSARVNAQSLGWRCNRTGDWCPTCAELRGVART